MFSLLVPVLRVSDHIAEDITESWELVPFVQIPNTPDIPSPASEHSLDQDDDVL